VQGEQQRHGGCRDQRERELVIRDLLTGTKRFTDLMDRLGGITPKTLSQPTSRSPRPPEP
jgi:hypothetical protein